MTDRALPNGSQVQNGKVVALSTLIAGVAGGITVFLNGRRHQQEEQELLAQLVESRRKELEELKAAVEAQRHALARSLAKAKQRGEQQLKDVGGRSVNLHDLAEFDWSGLSRRARKGLERARAEAAKRAPTDLERQRDALIKSGGEAAQAARSFGERTAEQLSKRVPELIEAVESEVAPRARAVGDRAAAVASASVASSKDVADSLKHKVDDARPEVEELAKKAKVAVSHAPEAFATEFHKAEEALGAIASDVQHHAGDIAHTVDARSREGAAAVKKGGKEGSSLLFWSGVAAGVVYFIFLNDEQRERVKQIAVSVAREAREIYADIQGEDGKF